MSAPRLLPARGATSADNPGPPRPKRDGMTDRLLDVREAASILGVKPSTLYQWAYQRRLPVVKLFGPRGALRFRLRDIEALIARSLRPALDANRGDEP